MHIEPGFIAPAKMVLANVAAMGVLAYYAKPLLTKPTNLVRAFAAAVFFSLFMQSFHMPVGASELHFLGAMPIYLLLGFVPTLFGFAAGLLVQGLVFEPQDLPQLAANSLSLILPLIALHYTLSRKLFDEQGVARISRSTILKLDAMYYAGVTSMVGFWLLTSDIATPFAAWASFASAYLIVVAAESLLTFATLRLIKRHEDRPVLGTLFTIKSLKLS